MLFNVLGVMVLLFMIIVAQVGIPDVSASTLEAMRKRIQEQLAQLQGLAQLLAGEQAGRERAERDLREEKRKRDAAEQAAVQAQRSADRARLQSDWMRSQFDDAAREADRLRPRPTDVVLVVDGSASMGPVLQEIASVVRIVAEIGARLTPRFRLGAVIYRDRPQFAVHPLAEIKPSVNGGTDAAMSSLLSFAKSADDAPAATSMKPIGSHVDVEEGLRQGLAMFGAPQDEVRRVIVLVGDVGCWEQDDNPNDISTADRQATARSVEMVRHFASRNDDARVLAIFSGDESTAHQASTIKFMKQLVHAAPHGRYSDDVSQIAAAVVEAAIERD